MWDPTLSDIDFKNKMTWVWATLKSSFKTSNNDEPFLLTSPPPSAVRPPAPPSTSSVSKIPSMNTPSSIPSSSSVGSDAKCVICLENGKDIVFQPCWHQVTCSECAIRLKECPICREVIAVRRRPYRYWIMTHLIWLISFYVQVQ